MSREDSACKALEAILKRHGHRDLSDNDDLVPVVTEIIESIKGGKLPGITSDFTDATIEMDTGIVPVEGSSNVTACGWENGTLAVHFKGGAVYHYLEVPFIHFEGAMASESFGRYLNAEIKPRFKFEKQQ